jgi:hypothetical protein
MTVPARFQSLPDAVQVPLSCLDCPQALVEYNQVLLERSRIIRIECVYDVANVIGTINECDRSRHSWSVSVMARRSRFRRSRRSFCGQRESSHYARRSNDSRPDALKRGVIASNAAFWNWWKNAKPRSVVIKSLDEHRRITATWTLANARPVKVTAPDLNVKGERCGD